jgi:Amt family ammonium transporter
MMGRNTLFSLSILLGLTLLVSCWSAKSFAANENITPEPSSASSISASPSTSAETPKEPELNTGDNAWMLVSSALVLMMTGPGLALFYGGLVRKKNVLGVMMQCIFLMCLMTVLWAIYGYTLGFGGDTLTSPPKWIGNLDHLCMKGVQAEWVAGASQTPMHPQLAIPRLTHMLFQGMFFIITPALICGAFAERMKFSAMVAFSILWGTLVYCPLCHWVWGGGILMFGSTNASICAGGALDFAGGTVVHISSGVSALVCALLLGKRLSYGSEPMPPHNLNRYWRGNALGRLVWVQCGKRIGRQ